MLSVGVGSSGLMCMRTFMKIGHVIKKLLGGGGRGGRHTDRHDTVSLSFLIK
jgi:hypothetical protein